MQQADTCVVETKTNEEKKEMLKKCNGASTDVTIALQAARVESLASYLACRNQKLWPGSKRKCKPR